MDILYIIGKGKSLCDNFELRISLRSIEKYGQNVERIFVAGYCSDWLSDEVIKIPFEQPYQKKDLTCHEKHINIVSTLLYVIDNSDISEDFLVSMDDHIYIRPVDFDNYPLYAKIVCYGEGKDKILLPTKYKNDLPVYTKFMIDTGNILRSMGLTTRIHTLHRNLHMSKSFLIKNRETIETMIKNVYIPEIFCWYGNTLNAEFVPIKDVLIHCGSEWYKANSKETEVYSVSDFKKDSGLYTLIQGNFPNKCKYEINDKN